MAPTRTKPTILYVLDIQDPSDGSSKRRFRYTNKAVRDRKAREAAKHGFEAKASDVMRSERP